jgi:hypothetical protein
LPLNIRLLRQSIALFGFTLCIPISSHADNSLNLQGTIGLIHVPSAEVVEHGQGAINYANEMQLNGQSVHNHNLEGAFGIFPHVEVGGRIAWFSPNTNLLIKPGEPRDLSANIKINIPYIPKNWFSLAIGRQDFGGQASYFEAKYIVASRQVGLGRLGSVNVDLGMGKSQVSKRLDGVFGGVEYNPFPWIGFLGENDGATRQAGLRLKTPHSWLPKGMEVALTSQLYTSAKTGGKRFFGLTLAFPLSNEPAEASMPVVQPVPLDRIKTAKVLKDKKRASSATNPSSLQENHSIQKPAVVASTLSSGVPSLSSGRNEIYQTLADQLKNKGFEHIQVGVSGKSTLVIALENNVYNQNELDGIGVALAIAQPLALGHFSRISFYLKNQDIAVFNVTVDTQDYGRFLKGQGADLPIVARYANFSDLQKIDWKDHVEFGWYVKPRLTLSPSLSYAVATELGVFDYSLALKSNVTMNLWPGAMVSASYLTPVSSTSNFSDKYIYLPNDKGGQTQYLQPFYPNRQKRGLSEISAQQALPLGRNVMTQFEVGRIRTDYNGVMNETRIMSDSGAHTFTTKIGSFVNRNINSDTHDVRLGRYQYYWSKYDTNLSATAGTFWGGDKGYLLDADFYFGDNAMSLFYKDTDAKFVGIKWTLPLTPRRDYNGPYGQVKGAERWGTALQTRIRNNANYISFSVADEPSFEWGLSRTYYNNNRLSPEYLYRHLDRLREAAQL